VCDCFTSFVNARTTKLVRTCDISLSISHDTTLSKVLADHWKGGPRYNPEWTNGFRHSSTVHGTVTRPPSASFRIHQDVTCQTRKKLSGIPKMLHHHWMVFSPIFNTPLPATYRTFKIAGLRTGFCMNFRNYHRGIS